MIHKLVQENLLSLPREIYSPEYSQQLLNELMAVINWQSDFVAFGRRFDIPRLQAWYADEGVHYRYSDNKLQSHAWIEPLLSIKQSVEDLSGCPFNSVLLTCYRNGDDYVAWHADDEAELGDAPVIASLSLGAAREFHYRHKLDKQTGKVILHSGNLIIMYPDFQRDWEHCIPSQLEVSEPRLNLTFRQVLMSES